MLSRQNALVNTEVLQLIACGDVSCASARIMFADHLHNIPPSTSVPFFIPFYEPTILSLTLLDVPSSATPAQVNVHLDDCYSDMEPPALLDGTDDSDNDDGIPPGLYFPDKPSTRMINASDSDDSFVAPELLDTNGLSSDDEIIQNYGK